ncbi:hypothetical protein QJS04_geneDACA012918 [Acorus gramineus]|uniref:Expp1 protein n=1 Tax=Acorus gramineus TaxID=55184 RepID=A0AAV9B1E8_ACOGR|nr:hypothetical protein QJS04_geneDACA012918 [Acorus gramineus]
MDAKLAALTAVFVAAMLAVTVADDTNRVYSPCADTKVQKDDGFSFGIAFSTKQSFSDDKKVQLSPCDRRLSLSSAKFTVFRPKVDEISLLTINTTLYPSVLEFKKGTLQNLYWKRDGCASCSGKSSFVCINKQNCAIRTSSCRSQGGTVDCSIGIQLAFSGTDKHDAALNSWYEVSKLRQYSLYGLYSNLKSSLTSQYNKFF